MQCLLPTAVVFVKDVFDNIHECRILLDTGSMSSFISENCIARLGLPRNKAKYPIAGLASVSAGFTRGVTSLRLISRYSSDFVEVNPYILHSLTSNVPNFEFDHTKFHGQLPVNLADPNYYDRREIDIIIGAERVFDILLNDTLHFGNEMPTARLTIFGWVVAGNIQCLFGNDHQIAGCLSFHTNVDLDFDLQKFWSVEDIQTPDLLTDEEKLAESHFKQNHSRNENGNFIVKLPFKDTPPTNLGSSLGIAVNRLNGMEKRFEHNPTLKTEYSNFINEYIQLDHMEKIPDDELNLGDQQKLCYLPHHAVFKADSSTTKLRVVFDASAKNVKGESLNQYLLVGPKIQKDLFSICLRARKHQFAFSADVEKMFRQILVEPNDQNYQRIVWRNSSIEPIQHFRLKTVTYGTSCAPFLAIRSLRQLGEENLATHPIAANVILNDFYVDDVISGADDVNQMVQIYNDLIKILASGGFNLRKWTSNCWALLTLIPENLREYSPLNLDDDTTIKLLGLQWHPIIDCFAYKVVLPKDAIYTKCKILSDACRIFDPLGFLSPAVTMIKIMLQQIWLLNYDWDDTVDIRIPRKLVLASNNIVEYHGFCDASEHAYSAVIYCVSHSIDGNTSVVIVAAKSKVAPLKQVSIPRLELLGALLLSRLFKIISESLLINNFKTFAWTDSKIVLSWLSAHPRRWKTFIGNRTSEILTNLPRDRWNHVSSADNPADLNSSGLLPSMLKNCEHWWQGPCWLKQDKQYWPNNKIDLSQQQLSIVNKESRPINSLELYNVEFNPTNKVEENDINLLINKSSSWSKLYRTIGYIRRFIRNCRIGKEKRTLNWLTTLELNEAKMFCYRLAQKQSFSNDLRLVRSNKTPVSKKLMKLNAFVDDDDDENILRVGGRIQKSTLPLKTKHPIILDRAHPIAKLIVTYYHQKSLHAGVAITFHILKEEYYIIGVLNMLKTIVYRCINCFRSRQSTNTQLMANYPVERVTYPRPFSKVGVDYAGPITIRLARGRNPKFKKACICLFICFTTKAFHIELASDLTTAAFLAALDRFCARRVLLSQTHNQIVADHLSQDGISWHVNPPLAPHFGGLWESGVKMVKSHMKRVLGEHILTFEELYTLLVNIEAILNSRPLIATIDEEDFALSPAHFLIGQQYTSIPHPNTMNEKVSLLSNWKLLKNIMQNFWKRWHNDYLTSLQQRPKWAKPIKNLEVNDVVVIREPSLPPTKWIIGRIVETYPGDDSKVRVASVKTSKGTYKRPIVKLIPLPIAENPSSSGGGGMLRTESNA